jgi:hypothetical protein
MEIRVELSRKDYTSYLRYYFLRKGIKKKMLVIMAIIIVSTVLSSIGKPFEITSFLSDLFSTLISVIFLVLMLRLIFGLLIRFMPMTDAKKMGKRKYSINREGIAIETETSSIFQKWTGIVAIEQNKDLILLFVNGVGAHIIPKRYFESQDRLNSFIAEINENKNAL